MKTVDLNCDMGESFGAWKMGDDAAIMPLISSANVACGFHGALEIGFRTTENRNHYTRLRPPVTADQPRFSYTPSLRCSGDSSAMKTKAGSVAEPFCSVAAV